MESAEKITFTVMYAVTFLVSLVGNTLLIYIVWKKPAARSLTSFMFVNMAVADLLVTMVVIPYTVSDFYNEGVWPMSGLIGEITCRAVLFVAFFTIISSLDVTAANMESTFDDDDDDDDDEYFFALIMRHAFRVSV
ncbi:hypothetical protein ACROYT_G018649 [Oculina patagonica]